MQHDGLIAPSPAAGASLLTSLEQVLKDKEAEALSLKQQYEALSEDFEYNLSLLNDRDAELGQLEYALEQSRVCLNERERDIAAMKADVEEVSGRRQEAVQFVDDAVTAYDLELQQLRSQLNEERRQRESSELRNREEICALQQQLESAIRTTEHRVAEERNLAREQAMGTVHQLQQMLKNTSSHNDLAASELSRLQESLRECEKQRKVEGWRADDAARAAAVELQEIARTRDELFQRVESQEQQLSEQDIEIQSFKKRIQLEINNHKMQLEETNTQWQQRLVATEETSAHRLQQMQLRCTAVEEAWSERIQQLQNEKREAETRAENVLLEMQTLRGQKQTEVQTAQSELAALRGEVKRLEEELGEARGALAAARSRDLSQQSQLQTLTAELEALKLQLVEVDRQEVSLRREHLKERLQAEQQIELLQLELHDLKIKIPAKDSAEAMLARTAQQQRDDAMMQLQEAESHLARMKCALDEANSRNERLERDVTELLSKSSGVMRAGTSTSTLFSSQQRDLVGRLQDENSMTRYRCEDLEKQNEKLLSAMRDMRQEMEHLKIASNYQPPPTSFPSSNLTSPPAQALETNQDPLDLQYLVDKIKQNNPEKNAPPDVHELVSEVRRLRELVSTTTIPPPSDSLEQQELTNVLSQPSPNSNFSVDSLSEELQKKLFSAVGDLQRTLTERDNLIEDNNALRHALQERESSQSEAKDKDREKAARTAARLKKLEDMMRHRETERVLPVEQSSQSNQTLTATMTAVGSSAPIVPSKPTAFENDGDRKAHLRSLRRRLAAVVSAQRPSSTVRSSASESVSAS